MSSGVHKVDVAELEERTQRWFPDTIATAGAVPAVQAMGERETLSTAAGTAWQRLK